MPTLLYELAGWRVPTRQVERIAKELERAIMADEQAVMEAEPRTVPTVSIDFDGTGMPVCKDQTDRRPAQQLDGSAQTREAKLMVG